MNKVYKKMSLLILTLISLSIFIIGYSLAWFTDLYILNPAIHSEDLGIEVDVYFASIDEPDNKIYPTIENKFLSNYGLIIIDVVDPEAINYIDNLKVNIKVRGTISYYLRVYIYEEFYKYKSITEIDSTTGEYPPDIGGIERQKIVQYSFLNDNWFDNREFDGYLYYKAVNNLERKNNTLNFDLLDGINDNNFPLTVHQTPKWFEGYIVSWSIKVDIVQSTRYQEVWKLNTLPWE